MANVDNPSGFPPVDELGGGNFVCRVFAKAAGDAVAIGINDLVDITGAADTVAQAAAGGPFTGVARSYAAASTASTHPVIILNTRTVCNPQEDSVGGAIAAASEGLNCDIIVAAANATSGLSQMELDSSTAATTSTLDTRLLAPTPSPDNTVASANARWLVLVNDLRYGDLKAGV